MGNGQRGKIDNNFGQKEVLRPRIRTLLQKQMLQRKTKLHVGMDLFGIVTKIEIFGAFVDIGLEKEALLHVSQLNQLGVRNVEDLLQVGDVISVSVMYIDSIRSRIALSLSAPPARCSKTVSKPPKAQRAKRVVSQRRRRRKRGLRYPYAYRNRTKSKGPKRKTPARMPNQGFIRSQTKETPKKIVMPIKNFAGFSNSSNDWDDLAWKNRFGKRKRTKRI